MERTISKIIAAVSLVYVCLPKTRNLLNLCVMATSNVQAVQNMWGVLKEVEMFFIFSPKRGAALAEEIRQSDLDVSIGGAKHVSICRTRWVARFNALVAFQRMYRAVVAVLEDMTYGNAFNADTKTKASCLLTAVTSFSFIATFMIVSKVMAPLQAPTAALQVGQTQF